jgi:hypothetical protein
VPHDHEWNKVQDHRWVVVNIGLLAYRRLIDPHVKYLKPVFSAHHLKECQHCIKDVIEVSRRVDPISSIVITAILIFYQRQAHYLSKVCRLTAMEELAPHERSSNDSVN